MGIEPTVPHKVGTYGFEDRGRHQTALFFRLILHGLTEQFFPSPLLRVQNVSARRIAAARLLYCSNKGLIIVLFPDGYFNLFQTGEEALWDVRAWPFDQAHSVQSTILLQLL